MFSKFGITLKEPSTWVGVISFLSLAGIQIAPEYTDVITKMGVAIGALLGVVFKWDTVPSTKED